MSDSLSHFGPKLSFIAAMTPSGVMGKDGGLPWHISSDLKFFKKTTLGKPVLMGRKTWESLPFALPGRPNLVLTRNADYVSPPAEVFTDMQAFVGRGFELAGEMGAREVMIIGGGDVFEKLMPYASRLYLTEVQADIKGDTYFPPISDKDWALTEKTDVIHGPKDDYPIRIKIYDRV